MGIFSGSKGRSATTEEQPLGGLPPLSADFWKQILDQGTKRHMVGANQMLDSQRAQSVLSAYEVLALNRIADALERIASAAEASERR